MKSKKILVLLILLAVILFLGIGYALSTTSLEIKGDATVTATDDNFVVKFTDAITNDANNKATGSKTDDTHAKITVDGLEKAGDTATVTYTIENASNGLDALVNLTSSIVASENGNADDVNYFEVTTEGITTDTKVEAGSTATVKVTVKLLKTPVEDKTATVKVDLTAKPAEQAN